ncbi:hypothetical protein GJ633_02985 [Halorubrum sp. CBA1125]|uniref:hypothetical protein n=1 Tax=Halorubrum sp. CBA1125 TaxID=2668072 RepID=UPI0012E73CE6|nr:hypothetical protein [Halorubrum sp. CBA1125]MUW13736.1 hypothetical protein [Halorubrum sp. CBA1125]
MRLLTIFATLLVATAFATGAVAAQENTTANASTNATEECTERINQYTAICSAELDGSDVVIDIYTEGPQTVVVTEAFRKGSGILEQRRVRLDEGRNTVRLTVTVDGGSEGVTIAAGDVLYQKEVRTSSTIVAGPFTASDAQAAGLGGGVGVALVTLYIVAKVVYGRNQESERLA